MTTIGAARTFGGVKDQFTDSGVALDGALVFWAQRVNQAARSLMYRRFGEVGVDLTPEQWMVLVRLWEREDQTQTELCDSTLRDRPTMSRILDVMEERGLVQRKPDPADARARRVRPTAKGRRLREKLLPLVKTMVEQLEKGIDDDELVVTRRCLQRMFDNLEGALGSE